MSRDDESGQSETAQAAFVTGKSGEAPTEGGSTSEDFDMSESNYAVYDEIEEEKFSQHTNADDAPEADEELSEVEREALEEAIETDDAEFDIQGSGVSVTGTVVGRKRTGARVVASAAGSNKGATTDANTKAPGLAADFGVFQNQRSFRYIRGGEVMEEPTGSTEAAIERIAGEQAELSRISEITEPVRNGSLDREKCIEIHIERLQECRQDVSVAYEARSRPLLHDPYDEIEREQRQNINPNDHEMPGAKMLTEEYDVDAEEDDLQVGDVDVPEQTPGLTPEPCRWSDLSANHPPIMLHPDEQRPEVAPQERETLDRVQTMTEKLATRFEEHFGDSDAWEALNIDWGVVQTKARNAAQETGDLLAAFDQLKSAVFHPTTTPMDEVQPWWTAASVRGRVTQVYEPNDPNKTSHVFKVEPLAPWVEKTAAGGATAKVTVWSRSEKMDLDVYEGDILELRNVVPGQFGNAQLTLAVLYDSRVNVVKRAEDISVSRRRQRLKKALAQSPDVEPVSEDHPEHISNISEGEARPDRYRRSVLTNVASTSKPGQDHDALIKNEPDHTKYRDSAHAQGLIQWTFDQRSCPDWFTTEREDLEVHLGRRHEPEEALHTADPAFDPAELAEADDYVPIHESAMETALARIDAAYAGHEAFEADEAVFPAPAPMEWEDYPGAEQVYRADIPGTTLQVQVYSSIVGEWARPADESSIKVTLWDTVSGDLLDTRQVNRTEGWNDRLADAVSELVSESA